MTNIASGDFTADQLMQQAALDIYPKLSGNDLDNLLKSAMKLALENDLLIQIDDDAVQHDAMLRAACGAVMMHVGPEHSVFSLIICAMKNILATNKWLKSPFYPANPPVLFDRVNGHDVPQVIKMWNEVMRAHNAH